MNRKSLTIIFILFTLYHKGQSYFVNTIAGTGTQGLVDGPGLSTAEMYWPYGLAYDGDSCIYFADAFNHAIRKMSMNNYRITTIAGNGTLGLIDGIGNAARFNRPDGLFYKNGLLYVGDNLNHCIRKIDLTTNSVTTIAGTGVSGYLDGPAASAKFAGGNGLDVVVDQFNNVYVADRTNACVRMISPSGIVSTFAGSPGNGYVDGPTASAKFYGPRYMTIDVATGDIFLTDINNHVIRKISGGMVTTFAGNGAPGAVDGPSSTASFNAPVGIARTIGGYFYVIDGAGNKLRKIDPSGNVSTVAGSGVFGFQDGAAATAEFNYPQGVCYDKNCFIYIADRNNNRIRQVSIPEGSCVLGVYENSENVTVSIYPNPTSGTFKIEGINKGVTIKVYNLLGELIASTESKTETTEIDLNEKVNGIYFIKIGSVTKKIIKE